MKGEDHVNEILALRKINRVLMDRVERSINSSGSDYAIFEQNILLQKLVDERTEKLEQSNLHLAKNLKDQRRISENLRESEETFRNIVQASPMGIHLYQLQDGNQLVFVGTNHAADKLLGVDNSQFIGMTLEEAFPPLRHTEIPSRYRKAALDGEGWQTEQIDYDDGKITGAFEVIVFQMSPGKIAVLFNDITKRKQEETEKEQLQKKLAQAQKIESMGLLAGGVAHDLNNILSGIISLPELLLTEIPKDHKMRQPIEIMRKSGLRASAIVQDLLTVARGVAIVKEPINILSIIDEYLQSPDFEMIKRHHPEVTLSTNLACDSANIMGSLVHIRKILMNLVSNSFEASNLSGHVTISLSNKHVGKTTTDNINIPENDYVILTVADQGKGIAKQDREKIFEPFYTRKVMGRSGTGLGLTVVWNVVKDHNGYIKVSSSDNGTQFTLYFPATEKLEQQTNLNYDLDRYKGQGETVLIIDDISDQRIITSSIIKKLGYLVESVSSGEAAIEYLQHQPVDLIILDMIMSPGISGQETYKQILQMHPDQKAIIVSGYAETEEVIETLHLGAGKFLKKPLLLKDLAIAIHNELTPETNRQDSYI